MGVMVPSPLWFPALGRSMSALLAGRSGRRGGGAAQLRRRCCDGRLIQQGLAGIACSRRARLEGVHLEHPVAPGRILHNSQAAKRIERLQIRSRRVPAICAISSWVSARQNTSTNTAARPGPSLGRQAVLSTAPGFHFSQQLLRFHSAQSEGNRLQETFRDLRCGRSRADRAEKSASAQRRTARLGKSAGPHRYRWRRRCRVQAAS
jgi:hypothetical protein